MHYAAADDELDVLRGLIREGAEVNARDDAGWTALHFAADRGNLDIAEELVRAGDDVNATNNRGRGGHSF
ncbi:ankyrin repeat domain-containing protein [Mycolicibacterium wolinskyi]|uniref:ankyrin repeat domain-containing protein n=1 Tax=Mycolicibacterium wolinskyi TaxID=59750 RepID=UPI003917B29F